MIAESDNLMEITTADCTDADITQDNFILPEPPVGGLPIAQDRLDRWT